MVVLSKRLKALADMVTAGNRVADVGCDHGFVSIYLVQNNIAPYVYAMDVRQGPLQRAKEHIASYCMENYIETRLSDGVQSLLPGEAESLVCAGMGGKLMQKILTEGREKVSLMQELILQPQSELMAFRAFLRREGYCITQEKMIYEEGKFYPMMRVIPGKMQECTDEKSNTECAEREHSQAQRIKDKFGEKLLEEKNPVLIEFLHYNLRLQREILEKLQKQQGGAEDAIHARAERIQEVLIEIEDMQAALSGMGAGHDNDNSNDKRTTETVSQGD